MKTLLEKGLSKIKANPDTILKDLNAHPEVLTEAIQTVMRKHGTTDAYEQLKAFSRGQALSLEKIHQFIQQSALPENEKVLLLALTPDKYV